LEKGNVTIVRDGKVWAWWACNTIPSPALWKGQIHLFFLKFVKLDLPHIQFGHMFFNIIFECFENHHYTVLIGDFIVYLSAIQIRRLSRRPNNYLLLTNIYPHFW
jgi:hypothetical protein